MKENKMENLVWIIFASIGTIFLIIGVIIFGNITDYTNKIDTIGTITEISSYRSTNDEIDHEVYVAYTIEGKKYKAISSIY